MIKKKIGTLIFDFDGTIADSVETTLSVLNNIAQELGYPNIKLTAQMLQTKSIPELIKEFNISIFKLPFLVTRVKAELSNHVAKLHPVKDMPLVLADLKKQGYQMHIITSNSEENVCQFLEKNSIACFESVYSCSSLFGKARVINKLIKILNIPKDQVLYIGDEVRDIEAAHQSGIKIVAVTWGFNSQKLLEEHKPDYLATTPEELLAKIEHSK